MVHQPTKSPTTAARLTGIATNVLATGLILILGAVGGKQALRWWSAARPTPVQDSLAPVIGPAVAERRESPSRSADAPMRHLLAFGDDSLLATRTELHGDARQVLARLRDDCRSIVARTTRVERQPGPAEQQLLARIRLQEPVEAESRWRMYQVAAPVPMVVTVLDQASSDTPSSSETLSTSPAELSAETQTPPETRTSAETRTGPESPATLVTAGADAIRNVAALESRVVSWGLAFPAVSDEAMPSDRWTLFTLTAETPRLGPIANHDPLPLPPESRRTMSLQAESGAVMVGFRGSGSMQAWRMYYDNQLAMPTWMPTSNWRHDGPIWQRSFSSPLNGRVDVQLIEEADGMLNGLLMSAPPRGAATEK